MTDLKQTVDYVFKNRHLYHTLTDEDKEYIFFIFNRFCSRLYPRQAQFLNHRLQDKAAAMDVWYHFFRSQRNVPHKFWGRKKKQQAKSEVPARYLNVLNKMNEELWGGRLQEDGFRLLWHITPEEVKFETKVYKDSRDPKKN